jgi:hypothetical protein
MGCGVGRVIMGPKIGLRLYDAAGKEAGVGPVNQQLA